MKTLPPYMKIIDVIPNELMNCFSRPHSGEEQDVRNQNYSTVRDNFNLQGWSPF